MSEMGQLTAVQLLQHFRDKSLSPVEVTEDALLRIERYNPVVNAYCHVDPEGALKPIETVRGRGYRFAIPRTGE